MGSQADLPLEYALFALFFIVAWGAISIWLLRGGRSAGLVAAAWVVLLLGLVPGWFLARSADHEERDRRARAIAGLAPTYAHELEELGHYLLQDDTTADDPLYLRMIDKQKRWLALNENVADIYTFRKKDGKNILIVDSETDYNDDGVFDRGPESKEDRSEIGTPWKEESAYLDRAYAGEAGFDDEPYQDYWGTWVSAYVPMRDPSGNVEAVLGVDFDAAEWNSALRRARWEALAPVAIVLVLVLGLFTILALIRAGLRQRQQGAERTRAILDQAHDAFVAMDEAGHITDWNPQSTAVFGWTREEVLGKEGARLLMPERYREAHRAGVERYLRTGTSQIVGSRIDVTGLHRDGREFPMEMTITAIHEDGHCHFNAFLHDITDRMQKEAQLLAAKDDAEAATRVKSEFIASVSHEIRTPLNGILGMGELLATTGLDERQQRYLRQLQRSSEDLLHLLNDVLDMSKVESGRIELESRPFDPRVAIGAVVDSARPRAESAGLGLSLQIDDDVPGALSGDPGRLAQILSNLVGNALKFTSAGGVDVQVGCASPEAVAAAGIDQDGGEGADADVLMHVAVSDTGIGIPPDRQEAIFEAFRQEDASTTRRYGGTGLGLSICRHLVARMGGEIEVRSVPGQGSTFSFTARFGRADPADLESGPPAPAHVLPAPDSPAASLPLHILLAEDGKVNQQVAVGLLELEGHRVDVVEDGKQAVEAVRRSAYDLVLMDLQMPVMDGLDATRVIRDLEGADRGQTPIIALTAIAMRGDRERCIRAGMDGYLAKPIDRTELRQMLATVRERRAEALPGQGEKAMSDEPPAADPIHVDWQVAARRIPGGVQGVRDLAVMMAGEGPRLLGEMEAGLEAGDAERVRLAAHTLRGSVHHFGGEALVEAALAVEACARAGDLEGCAAPLARLAELVTTFGKELALAQRPELKRWLAGDGA